MDLREKVMDIVPRPVITKDSVTVFINAMLFYQFTDLKLPIYGEDQINSAIFDLMDGPKLFIE